MLTDLLGALTCLVLFYAPGWAALTLLSPHRLPWWVLTPAAPLAGAGAVYVVAAAAQAVHLPFTPAVVLPVLAVLTAAAGVLTWRRRGRDVTVAAGRRRELRDGFMVTAIAAVGLAVWLVGWHGAGVLPNFDAMNHAQFVHNIAVKHTTDPALVAAPNPLLPSVHSSFYPLALHQVAALTVQLTGWSAVSALFLVVVLFAAVVLSGGMYALARSLELPRRVPLLAAGAVLCLPEFPYKAISWGGVPAIAAVACLPAAIALARVALRRGAPGWPVIAFAAGALSAVHSSELPAFVALFALFVAPAAIRRHRARLVRPLPLAGGAVLGGALLAPQILGLLSVGGGVATGSGGHQYLTAGAYLFQLATQSFASVTPNPLVAAVLVAGAVLAVRRHRVLLAAVAGWLLFAVLAGWAAHALPGWSVLQRLTVPWYEQTERLSYYLVLFVALLAAAVLDALIDAVGNLSRLFPSARGDAGAERQLRLLVGAVVCLLLGAVGVSQATGCLQWAFGNYAVVDPVAVQWGQTHPEIAAPGVTVLSAASDGSMWLYAASGVRVTGAFGGVVTPQTTAWSLDRAFLLKHIADYRTDPRVAAEVRAWNIRFLFVNRHMDGSPQTVDVRALRASGGFREIDSSGAASLWELTAAP